MKTRRPIFALALTLFALLGGLSVPCAMAESCVCVVEKAVPEPDVSGEADTPDVVLEQAAAVESSNGRSTVALHADFSKELSLDAPRTLRERAREHRALSPSTPLYIRNCAFLC